MSSNNDAKLLAAKQTKNSELQNRLLSNSLRHIYRSSQTISSETLHKSVLDMHRRCVHPNNQATYKACVSRYGTPLAIMIDQGTQFESALFKMLRKQRSLHRHFSNCPARTTMQFLRDLDTSSTELVFGTTLQLAEEWFANVNTDECVPHIF